MMSAFLRFGPAPGPRVAGLPDIRHAGKGGTIPHHGLPQPRRLQGSSLPAPSDREKTQIYTQRYLQHFLAAGEVVICDLSSYTRAGIEYVRTRDLMLKRTDTRIAPWYLVRPDDKRTARLNTPAHVLPLVPYKMLPQKKLKPPGRSRKGACDDEASIPRRRFVRDQY